MLSTKMKPITAAPLPELAPRSTSYWCWLLVAPLSVAVMLAWTFN